MELDLYLPEEKIGIEFDGNHWHKNKITKDKQKNYKFKKFGINVIRLREKPLEKLEKDDVVVQSHNLVKNDINNLLISI